MITFSYKKDIEKYASLVTKFSSHIFSYFIFDNKKEVIDNFSSNKTYLNQEDIYEFYDIIE